jgi:hypothetical protein
MAFATTPLKNRWAQVRFLMVPQEGECCAWRLQGLEGSYSRPVLTTLQDAPAALGSVNIELRVELRDMAEPVEPVFPRNKGPALIYCGIILGGISFIMLGLTPILMFLVYVRTPSFQLPLADDY